ncbi:MAG: SulP family inorganic anion transporter [Acidimicrobiia bacterium]|nr:SulP family inorganic anion transporter [Acidimicrobiia bacterium]
MALDTLSSTLERPRRGDLIAGLSVAIVLIPQSLAYAEIAGLPAFIGLYAAALPPLAAAFLASSRYLQTGPVAMTALLTFGALSDLATPGSDAYIEQAIVLALIVGLARIVLGLVRGGIVAYLMSSPVLIGFTSAAAILIVASQIPTALGVAGGGGGLLGNAWDALIDPGAWSAAGLGVGLIAAAVLVAGRRVSRRFPGVLLAVIVGLIYSQFVSSDLPVVGEVPTGLPAFQFTFGLDYFWNLVIPGIVIALVGFAEAAAISRTFATQDRERWDPNREFISQGVANVASAISGGFPVGGSFSRSSIAKISGAQTRWAGAVTGLAVLAFLPFASVIESLPRAVLAAIVIVAVFRLIRVATMVRLIGKTWGQAFVAWATFIATLVLSPRIDLGVVIGLLVAAAVHFRRETLLRVSSDQEAGLLVLRPSGVLFYGSAPRLDEAFSRHLAAFPDLEEVVIDLEGLGRIDYTGALALKEFIDSAEAAGLEVSVRDIPEHAQGTLERSWGDELTHHRWEG